MIISDKQITKLKGIATMYLLELNSKNECSPNPYALSISNLLKDIQNQQLKECYACGQKIPGENNDNQ